MCVGMPGRIVSPPTDRPKIARVSVDGVERDIDVALLDGDPVRPGDWVVIHAGFALERLTEADALDTIGFLKAEAS